MAAHIESIEGSTLAKVTTDAFAANVQIGDYLFCSGRDDLSKVIEKETNSPFSHVLMAWRPFKNPAAPWLTLEATIDKGVHVGLLSDYIGQYDGDLVLARRPDLISREVLDEIGAGLKLLDDRYNWQTEVTYAAHRLLKVLPIAKPDNRLYCSALQQVMSQATAYPITTEGPIPATPEQVWTDPSIVPVCVLVKK